MGQVFRLKLTLKDGKEKLVNAAPGGNAVPLSDEDVVALMTKHNVYPDATKIEVVSKGHTGALTAPGLIDRLKNGKASSIPITNTAT